MNGNNVTNRTPLSGSEPSLGGADRPRISGREPRLSAEATLPTLLDALRDADPARRRVIVAALGRLGPDALPPLLTALRDADPRLRWAAARALERIGDARAAPSLIEALRDTDYLVRLAAIRALERIGTTEAVVAVDAARAAATDWLGDHL